MINKYTKNKNSGFTLLFASLIGSLVFTIGLAILSISIKQLSLTTAGRESQQSFYSADAGIECALLLDRGAGDSSCRSGFFGVASSTAPSEISVCDTDSEAYTASEYQQCYGHPIDITREVDSSDADSVISSFTLSDNVDTDICFNVQVVKKLVNSNYSYIESIIESRGYNKCNPTNNPNLSIYERAIRTFNY